MEKAHPELTVRRQVTKGSARSALLAAAFDAQMLVVGARGLGGVHGMLLGSVSHAASARPLSGWRGARDPWPFTMIPTHG